LRNRKGAQHLQLTQAAKAHWQIGACHTWASCKTAPAPAAINMVGKDSSQLQCNVLTTSCRTHLTLQTWLQCHAEICCTSSKAAKAASSYQETTQMDQHFFCCCACQCTCEERMPEGINGRRGQLQSQSTGRVAGPAGKALANGGVVTCELQHQAT